MIDTGSIIRSKYDKIELFPKIAQDIVINSVKRLIYEEKINSFLKEHEDDAPFDFIEAVLEYFNFSYKFASNQIENIPPSGKCIIIANHPLGGLDALSLIDMIRKVRVDVKIMANDVLSHLKPLKPILLDIDVFSKKISKKSIEKIYSALDKEQAIIIFPSGEVSRAKPNGIKDTKWHKGFLKFAIKKQAPILPVYIKARNSSLFYTISSINKKISTLLLPMEMFRKKNKQLDFKIGQIVPPKSFIKNGLDINTNVKLFKKHLYKIAKDKKPIFATQKCISHPESRQLLKEELKNTKELGITNDGKKIYLFEYKKGSSIMKEIARLRELTFRAVEEGTGEKKDTDNFDKYYKHIVLWDDEQLEIVGSYRIGDTSEIYKNFGKKGLYTDTLFDISEKFFEEFSSSIELGRSFVQPKFWGSRALDYLWFGIGAYLKDNPGIKYMFGPVSLSSMLPKKALNLIIFYYDLYYGGKKELLKAKESFIISKNEKIELENIFLKNDKNKDFLILKEQLSFFGVSVPTLYKQYTNLCEDDGIKFITYNIDKEFNNCVDSFILIDIAKIKSSKRKRYIKGTINDDK